VLMVLMAFGTIWLTGSRCLFYEAMKRLPQHEGVSLA
jgi:hypothetical protein